MRISNLITFMWLQVITLMLFLNNYNMAFILLSFGFVITIGFMIHPSKNKKLVSVFVFFSRLFKRKIKRLFTVCFTFLIFVTIISSYFSFNAIINTHYDDLLYSTHFSSGDFQVRYSLFGIEKTSEIDYFFNSTSDKIVNAFNESFFPGNIYQYEWLLLLKIQYEFYYEYKNITGELINGTLGLNGYLITTEGSFWDYLLSILGVESSIEPDFILFKHNLSLVEYPDLGFAKNISFFDPFSYNSRARYVFLNTSASNCSIISLVSYESTLSFKKMWDLPTLPGSLIVCTPSFFKRLFPREDIIQPNNEALEIHAEWRGWINKRHGFLQQYNYTIYYNQFKQSLLNEIGDSNILDIQSNFVNYYQSLVATLSSFSNNFLIVEIPFFIIGSLLFLFGYKELVNEEKALKEWFNQRGIEFPSPFLYNTLKAAIIFISGFIGGIVFALCLLIFPLALFNIPLKYLLISFSKIPLVSAISLESIIGLILLFHYYQLFTDRIVTERKTIFSTEQLNWFDYSIISLLVIMYPLITTFLRVLNNNVYNLKLESILLGCLFGILSIFVVLILRKLIQHLLYLAIPISKRLKFVWNVGFKIYNYLATNASGVAILMILSISFIHFSTNISFHSISYYSNVSGMYVGADIKLSGLDFNTEQLELLQNLTFNDIQSYTVFQNLTINDFRDSGDYRDVQYHLIGINTSTFSQTAFFSEYFFNYKIRSLITNLKENQTLVCSSTREFFNAEVGDNITLNLPVFLPLGNPYKEFTFSIVGTFTYWPGYNNLNSSDPVYSNENKKNLIIVVSLETYNKILSIIGVSSSTILIHAKDKNKIDYIVGAISNTLLRYYSTIKIQRRYIPSSISDFRSIPELVFLLSFMSMIFLYSLIILSISLFLLFQRYSKLLSPIISRLYGHGFTFKDILNVLFVDVTLYSFITLLFTPPVALSYHYAYILILSRIFFEIRFSMKISFDFITISFYIIVVFYNLLLCCYFARKIGKQKEIVLPRVIV